MANAYDDFGGDFDPSDADDWTAGQAKPKPVSGLRRLINLAGAASSIALVVGAVVWGYNLALRDVQGVPVIQALDGPMRVSPADPGGEIVDYQGLAVNDVAAEGLATPLPDRLVLAPRPAELDAEDVAGLTGAGLDTAATPAAVVATGESPVLAAEPLGESASPTEIAIDAALAEALGEVPAETLIETVAEDNLALEEDGVDTPVEAVPAGAMAVSPRPRARPGSETVETSGAEGAGSDVVLVDPATIPLGTRLVQFGAYDTEAEAREEWARLETSYGELMAGKSMVLQPAERSGHTFYRLRAHGFEDEDDARRFCVAISAGGAVCIPVAQR